MFKGIFIRMKPEKSTKHHRAHIHAMYQGKEATFDVRKLGGRFRQTRPFTFSRLLQITKPSF